MSKLIVISPQGIQEIAEISESGSIAVDSDTGLPVMQCLWDERTEGELTGDQLTKVGGFSKSGTQLVYSQSDYNKNEELKASLNQGY